MDVWFFLVKEPLPRGMTRAEDTEKLLPALLLSASGELLPS